MASVYGVRPKRSFVEAATKFLNENQHKKSLRSDAGRLRELVKYIGNLSIDAIHAGTLQPFIEARRRDLIKTRTINHGLKIVFVILNFASTKWLVNFGLKGL